MTFTIILSLLTLSASLFSCNSEIRHIVIIFSGGKYGFSEPTAFDSIVVRTLDQQ